MTVPTTAPIQIKQLATQLAACAAWTAAGGTAANIYYPAVAFTSSITLAAELSMENFTVSRPFIGVTIAAGELIILIHQKFTGDSSDENADDCGGIETLASTIASQICTDTGLENLQVSGSPKAVVPDDAAAVTSALRSMEITLIFGLDT